MRILSLEEFRQGNIPSPDDFEEAFEEFKKGCIYPYLGCGVIGGLTYGSRNRNDFKPTSDIDYLVLTEDDYDIVSIENARNKQIERKNVHIEPRIVRRSIAESGMHTIDPSFMEHLSLTSEFYGFDGNNPVKYLTRRAFTDSGPKGFRQSITNALSGYIRFLDDKLLERKTDEDGRLKFIKSLVEKPFHTIRVAVQYYYGSVLIDGKFVDSKKELEHVYKDISMVPSYLIEKMKAIIQASDDYTNLIESRNNSMNPEMGEEYMKMLDCLEELYPVSLGFIEGNAIMISSDAKLLDDL